MNTEIIVLATLNLLSADAFNLVKAKILLFSKEFAHPCRKCLGNDKVSNILFYYIPSSEILEFPSVINFDIISSDDINFHFHRMP